jgi:two-component sensor histidine kinase
MPKKRAFKKIFAGLSFYMLCCTIPNLAIAQNLTARTIDLPGSFNRDLQQMCRDDDGFIWFGTNEGVWRFDGTDVKLLDYKKLKLPQNSAPGLLYCYGNFIFFYLNDVLRIYNRVTDECTVHGLQSWITNINQTADGGLLFFTRNGQSWKFTPTTGLQKSFHLHAFAGWEERMSVAKSVIDSNGDIYIFAYNRVGRIVKKNIQWGSLCDISYKKNAGLLPVMSMTAITSKYLAASYQGGQVVIYDKQTLDPVYQYSGNNFACCLAVNDKIVLLPHTGIKQPDYQLLPFFQVRQGLLPELSGVSSMATISTQNKFLLCTNGGLVELTLHGNEHKYDTQAKLVSFFRNKSIRGIFRVKNNLYVGTYSGFYKCSGDSISQLSPLIIFSIKQVNDHTLLLAIEGGVGFMLYDLLTGKFEGLPDPNRDHNYYVSALYHDSLYGWLGGDFKALHQLRQMDGKWSQQIIVKDTAIWTVRQIKRIRGKLFVAAQNGLSILDGDKKLEKIYPNKDLLRIYCMQETADGIWLGTHGNGLVKIDDNGKVLQQVGFNEGLAGNFVYSLAVMGHLLVAGTSNGLSIFNMANGGVQPLPIKQDDSLSGLPTEECNHSALFYDTALQQVILGGVKGLIFVDGKDYMDYPSLKGKGLVLAYIKTGGHETISAEADLFAYTKNAIVLKPEDANVTLKFASPDNPGQTEGLFRISGLNDKWQRIKIGQEVNLYALPPGKYMLEARLPSAVNNSQWFTKPIIVQPAFYQTIYFKIAVLLCFLGIVYLLWRSKVKKMERELRLRATIASDLHDDIGSTLNSISLYTSIAGQQLQNDTEKAKLLLDKMGTASRGMIDNMNDIVWAINPKNDDFENVLQRMQFFAGELLSGKNILLNFKLDERVKKLRFSMEERKNIYLIFKEAINNIFKYSAATRVDISIAKEAHTFILSIKDNGNGFEPLTKSNVGNGMANMKNRAKEIWGGLSIDSMVGIGTEITLRLKLG